MTAVIAKPVPEIIQRVDVILTAVAIPLAARVLLPVVPAPARTRVSLVIAILRDCAAARVVYENNCRSNGERHGCVRWNCPNARRRIGGSDGKYAFCISGDKGVSCALRVLRDIAAEGHPSTAMTPAALRLIVVSMLPAFNCPACERI